MNTMWENARRVRRTKVTAAVVATVLAAGLAATAAALPARAADAGSAAAVATTASQPLLREGSRGAAVQHWQATLNKLADKGMPAQPKIAADGIFGPKTKAATVAFQKWAHITADGIVGPQTRAVAATALSSTALDPNPHLKPVLRQGSVGAAVQDWQATLNKLAAASKPGQAAIPADGIFGPKTKTATVAFQKWAHITADGIVGMQTYTAAAQALG